MLRVDKTKRWTLKLLQQLQLRAQRMTAMGQQRKAGIARIFFRCAP
jgi:hypothetical protein